MFRKTMIIGICVFLTGCGSLGRSDRDNDAVRGPYPDNWKSIVADYIRNHYYDPDSVKDSEAAAPFKKRDTLIDPAWTVCIRNNAKNRMGGYTGRSITSLDIRNGQVVGIDKYEPPCLAASYEPFPLSR